MGLDIWFRDDIANILRAANEANLSAIMAGEEASRVGEGGDPAKDLRWAYRRGFVAALAALAQALGLPPVGVERTGAERGESGGWTESCTFDRRAMLPGGTRCVE